MRSLVLLATAILAVATCQADTVNFNPLENLQEFHAKSKSLTHHFGAMQATTATSNSECQAVLGKFLNLTYACLSTLQAIYSVDATNTTSVAAATTACTATCLTDLKNAYKGYTTTQQQCLSSYSLYAMIGDVYCAKSNVKDEICAVVNNRAMGSCSQSSESNCNLRENCEWNATLSRCTSRKSPSNAFLDSFCASGCMDRLITAYATLDANTAQQVRVSLDAVCLKAGGAYCLGIYNELRDFVKIDNILKERPPYCKNATLFVCLRTYMGFAAAQTITSAESSLRYCLTGSTSSTAAATTEPSADRKKSCMQSYLIQVQSADKLVTIIDVGCATTDGSDTGKPCVPLYYNISMEPSVSACGQALDRTQTCNETCDTVFTERISTLGCCAFYVMQLSTNPLPDDKRIPAVTGAGSLTFVGANYTKVSTPDSYFAACAKSGANKTLLARCTVAENARIKKSMKTNMAFAEISKDSALFARLKLALRKDVATSLGISEDAILNDDITEDTSRQVTVKVASSRQQSTSTETKKNAAKYDFTLAGQDEAATKAAAAKFDTQSSAGTLQTSSTQSAVSSCTSCAQSGSVAAPATGSTGTTTSGAFSLAASAVVAVVIAAAAML